MQELRQQLEAIVGAERVITDPQQCAYFAQDVYSAGPPAGVVIQPSNTEQLAAAVGAAVQAGHAVVSRGGGMSYTGGYTPAEEDAVTIDLSRMNRILELNEEDMYVTVEAGVTWAELHKALSEKGLRTPYWGTLSGLYATVGGGLSQNAIFWGSGRYGTAVDSVLGMDVVLADGSVLSTGSAAQVNASPFFRHFGPDITGLFTADCGAMGIKATATLRLIPEKPYKAFGSFAFEDYLEAVAAMSEISRRDLAMECFGFDPYLQQQRMKRESLAADMKKFTGVLKSAGGLGKAIKAGAKVATAGRGFMDDVKWSFHVMTEARSQGSADKCLQEAREIVARNGGRELPDSIPRLVRSNPFGPVNNMLGAEGERWAPVHGLVPHSRATEVLEAVEALFASHREAMEALDVHTGYLITVISTHCFVIEPVFFWPDEIMDVHKHFVEDDHLKRITRYEQNLPARELVAKVRGELAELFSEKGCVHLQVAKSYRYKQGLNSEMYALVQNIKNILDPTGRINPGNLGL